MTIKGRWISAGALILAASLFGAAASAEETADAVQKSTGATPETTGSIQTTGVSKDEVKPAEKAVPVIPVESVKSKKLTRRVSRIDKDGSVISTVSLAARTSLCRQDCKPNNLQASGLGIHGHYRGYGQWDPQLKSIEGQKQFAACVKRCLEPTPWFAVGQRAAIAMSGKFFGKTKEDCLSCHSKY